MWTTFGLALDSSGGIWQYAGSAGMIKLGTVTPPVAPPTNTSPPTVTIATGTLSPGGVLACNAGSWVPTTPAPSYARQWRSNGVPISGATGTAYTIAASDVGNDIDCLVTAVNPGGQNTAASNAVGPIEEA